MGAQLWWCGTCVNSWGTREEREAHFEEFPDHGHRAMQNRSKFVEDHPTWFHGEQK